MPFYNQNKGKSIKKVKLLKKFSEVILVKGLRPFHLYVLEVKLKPVTGTLQYPNTYTNAPTTPKQRNRDFSTLAIQGQNFAN